MHLHPTLFSLYAHSNSVHWWNQKRMPHQILPQHSLTQRFRHSQSFQSTWPQHFHALSLYSSKLLHESQMPYYFWPHSKKAKQRWITKLNTHCPIGLNTVTQLNTIDIPLILKFSNFVSSVSSPLSLSLVQFNNETYLQTKGTVMGKKYAPAFANIFMHYWEQQALSSTNYTPLFWKRYIDDIFGIWRHSEDQLHTFIQHLNSINPNIKVSITHNLHSINFLDCNVFKNHSKLSTKVYSKPTDTHKLLHPKSYHPAHVFKGIVKAQLLRYIRLSSHFHDFMQSYRILKSNLLNYGYTRSFIRFCKQSALSLTNCQRNSMITGCQPCRSKQCRMCFYTRSTAIVTSNLHNHTFPITQNTCCNTRNCIYTIHCTLWTHIPTIYVGETKNCIRSRFSQHKHNITTHNKDTVVSKHFDQTNHNLSMLRISVVQFFTENPKNSRKTDFMRKKYELLWINKLHTYTPIGLNIVTHLKSANIPLILKYSNSAFQLLRQVKNTLSNDTTYPNKFSITSSFTNHKNLQNILAPTKF